MFFVLTGPWRGRAFQIQGFLLQLLIFNDSVQKEQENTRANTHKSDFPQILIALFINQPLPQSLLSLF